jgi:hypothetical protein
MYRSSSAEHGSWWVLAVGAGITAVVETATAAVNKRLLPRLGIVQDSRRWTLIEGPLQLLALGALIGLLYLV